MDAELIRWLLAATGPAFVAVWLWYTKVYQPSREKRLDNGLAHNRKQADSAQQFVETIQTTALDSQLGIVKQLVTHIIESNNGHMSKLTEVVISGMAKVAEAVILGDKEHTAQLEKMTAAYNQALVTLSRAAAFPSVQRSTGGMEDIDDILKARVETKAVEVADAIVKTATASIEDRKTDEVAIAVATEKKEPDV